MSIYEKEMVNHAVSGFDYASESMQMLADCRNRFVSDMHKTIAAMPALSEMVANDFDTELDCFDDSFRAVADSLISEMIDCCSYMSRDEQDESVESDFDKWETYVYRTKNDR